MNKLDELQVREKADCFIRLSLDYVLEKGRFKDAPFRDYDENEAMLVDGCIELAHSTDKELLSRVSENENDFNHLSDEKKLYSKLIFLNGVEIAFSGEKDNNKSYDNFREFVKFVVDNYEKQENNNQKVLNKKTVLKISSRNSNDFDKGR